MKHELPKLPYAYDFLTPAMSKETLEFHHDKHHQAYVNNLNNLIMGTPFESASLEEIIKKTDGPIFNNAAQVWNHTFFFEELSSTPKTRPEGELAVAITKSFGSFDAFVEKFTKASVGLFGSGWVWLVADKEGKLEIIASTNAGNPLRDGFHPLLACDVWEHSYYIDYRNRRPDYVNAFMGLVDWNVIEKRYTPKKGCGCSCH